MTISRRFRIGPLRAPGLLYARPRWLQELTRRRKDVLPLYTPQRAGWVIAGRRTLLLGLVLLTAMFYGIAAAILPINLLLLLAAPYALIGLVVIWVLPDARSVPIRWLVGAYLLYFAVQLLWPNYLAFQLGGLPWIALRRLVGIVATFLLLICLSMSRKVRGEMADILKNTRPVSTFFIVFFFGLTAASFFSVSPADTIGRYVGGVLVNIPMFFITLWVLGTQTRSVEWWSKWFLIFVAILMAIGFVEYKVQHVLWSHAIPSFLHVDDKILAMVLTPNFRGGYRVVTTFTGPLVWGELTALAIPFVLHRLANAKTSGAFLAWLAMDFLVVLSGYLSGARLAVVGGIVAHVVYLFFWSVRRWRTQPGSLIGVSTTMLYPAFMIVLLGAILFVPAVHHRVLGGGATQGSNYARQEQFRMTIPAVAKRPLFGYGPGMGGQAVGWRNEAGFLSIDSSFLSTAADLGLVGLISYYGAVVAMILMLGYRGLLSTEPGMPMELMMSAVYITFMTCRSVLSQGDNDMLYWMLFGIGVALLYLKRPPKPVSARTA